MKAKKTNHFQEDADKIKHIPEEKNDGHDEPIKVKKPKKNRFLACLRKTWARIAGCMRSCCTCIRGERSPEELPEPRGIDIEELPAHSSMKVEQQRATSGVNMEDFQGPSEIKMEEELPESTDMNMEELPGCSHINMQEELKGPSGINIEVLPEPCGTDMEEFKGFNDINMKDSKANVSSEEKEKEDYAEENQNQNIKTNEEAKLVTDSFVEREIEAEYKRVLDVIHSQENVYAQYYASQVTDSFVEQEIEAEYQRLHDLTHSLEDLYIEYYASQEAEVGVTDSFVEQEIDAEYQRLHDLIHSLDDQYVRCYATKQEILTEYEHTHNLIQNIEDLYIPYYNGEYKEEQNEVPGHINSRANESFKGKEEEDDEGENTSIDSNEDREQCRTVESSIKCSSLVDETPEKLHKFSNTSQSGSSHDEEPSTSDICLGKRQQPGEERSATVALTLKSFTFHKKLGEGNFGDVYLASDIIRKERVAIKESNKQYFTERGYGFVERDILEFSHECPFLIKGLAAFHTENSVYHVMELAPRGDLYSFLRENRHLDHLTIQFIIAEIICGIQFLHNKNIIHRDLKTQNILLTADGHIKIIDFGMAAMDVHQMTIEPCGGTLGYIAPEVLTGQRHGRGVDYFAIGVILYRMHTSRLPFSGKKRPVLEHTPVYPESLNADTVNILKGLLNKNQYNRLGVQSDVRKHPYFSNINWEDVEARRVIPPAIMTAASVDLNMYQTLNYAENQNKIRSKDQKIFKEFSFVCPEWSHHYHPQPDVTIKTKSWMAKLFDCRPCKEETN